MVINAIKVHAIPLEIQGLIKDIMLLYKSISSVSLVHIRTSGNKAVQSLAGKAMREPDFFCYPMAQLSFITDEMYI